MQKKIIAGFLTVVMAAMLTTTTFAADASAQEIKDAVAGEATEEPANEESKDEEKGTGDVVEEIKNSDDDKKDEEELTDTAKAAVENAVEEVEEIQEVEATPTPTPVEKKYDAASVPKASGSKKEKASDNKWDLTGKGNKDKQNVKEVYISNGVNRFEVFYTAKSLPPEIAFQSPKGDAYRTNVDNGHWGDKFVVRDNNIVIDYPDIKYMVLYIDGTEEPGYWKMGINCPKNISEIFIASTATPDNWQNMVQEYKLKPDGIILWGIDKDRSQYTAANLTAIVAKDKEIPEANIIAPMTEEELNPEKERNPVAWIITLVVIVIAGGTVGIFFLFKKLSKESEESKKLAIKTANNRVKQKKKIENDKLDKVIEKYDEEYSDDDDINGYLSFSDEYLSTDSIDTSEELNSPMSKEDYEKIKQMIDSKNKEPEIKNNTDEPEDIEVSVPKTEEDRDETPGFIPEWKRQKAPVEGKIPSWMVSSDDDDDVLF